MCESTLARPGLCSACGTLPPRAPELCSRCAGIHCVAESDCLRPWRATANVDSYHARYLALEPSYRLLKRWKVRRSPALGRLFLAPELADAALGALDPESTVLVPIPHSPERLWELGGSPPLEICRKLSRELRLPIREWLASKAQGHQGERGLPERLSRRRTPTIETLDVPNLAPKAVIVVDDFMTSGATLESAARALKRAWPAVRVHAFVLAVRPYRIKLEEASATLQCDPSPPGPDAIRPREKDPRAVAS